MHENTCHTGSEHEVGLAWQVASAEAVAKSDAVKESAYCTLRRRILAADAPHIPASAFGRQSIHSSVRSAIRSALYQSHLQRAARCVSSLLARAPRRAKLATDSAGDGPKSLKARWWQAPKSNRRHADFRLQAHLSPDGPSSRCREYSRSSAEARGQRRKLEETRNRCTAPEFGPNDTPNR